MSNERSYSMMATAKRQLAASSALMPGLVLEGDEGRFLGGGPIFTLCETESDWEEQMFMLGLSWQASATKVKRVYLVTAGWHRERDGRREVFLNRHDDATEAVVVWSTEKEGQANALVAPCVRAAGTVQFPPDEEYTMQMEQPVFLASFFAGLAAR